MPVLRSIFNQARKFNLPDTGLSENLFGGQSDPIQAARTPQGTNINGLLFDDFAKNPSSFGPMSQVTEDNDLPFSGLGQTSQGPTGTGSNTGAASGGTPAPSTQTDTFGRIQDAQQAAEERVTGAVENVGQRASDIFAPIVGDLDAQLSRLPERRGTLTDLISQGAESVTSTIQSEQERLLGGLEGSEQTARQRNKRTLRDLAETARNSMQAAGQFIGSLGAGDSSAVGQASGAVTRQALKQRGRANEQLNNVISQIDNQRAEVARLASQKLVEVQQQKQQELTNLASQFQNIQQELESAKAQATSDERRMIAEQQSQLEAELRNRLAELENSVINAQSTVDSWQRQRQADLQDFSRRLASAGTFTGLNEFSSGQKRVLDSFNTLSQSFGPAAAKQILANSGISQDQLQGLELLSLRDTDNEEDLLSEIEGAPQGGGTFSNGQDDVPFFPG